MSSTTIISAPGKVLAAGGYLVLDPAYSGIVISTSSRFYAIIQNAKSGNPYTIRVRSPQFLDGTWFYTVRLEPTVVIVPAQDKYVKLYDIEDSATDRVFLYSTSENKFVQLALQHAIALVVEARGTADVQVAFANGLDVTIVGGNDFYSQRSKVSSFLPARICLIIFCLA